MLFSFSFVYGATSLGVFRIDRPVELLQTCDNGITLCSQCVISSVKYPNSSILISNVDMIKRTSDFYYSINVSTTGNYVVDGWCTDGEIQNTFHYNLEVTPNGEVATIGKAVLYIGLLSVLLLFFVVSIFFFMKSSNLLARVGSFGFSYVILTVIFFVGWNMANDFLTSAPVISDFLRVMFFVFMIGAFPMLIGAFAWYLIMLFKIKEIERLMTKGIGFEEAERRQGSKYK
jgi:hypothetical protein